MKKILLLTTILISPLYAKEEEPVIEQIKLGNFALESSQQISPLFSFGQTVVEKNDLLTYLYDYPFVGCNEQENAVYPTIIYGITDATTLLVAATFFPVMEANGVRTQGVGDTLVQFEHVLHQTTTTTSANTITGVASVLLPTGKTAIFPALGSGSPVFLLGLTASHLSIDWYTYVSSAAVLPTEYQCANVGKQFWYQGGFGRSLGHFNGWIVSLNLEFNGFYIGHSTTTDGQVDPNTGGSIFTMGPTLWVSSEHFSLQAGINGTVGHRLNGQQNLGLYIIGIAAGWTFHLGR